MVDAGSYKEFCGTVMARKYEELNDRAKENGYTDLSSFFDRNALKNFREMSKILRVSPSSIKGAYENYASDLFTEVPSETAQESKK